MSNHWVLMKTVLVIFFLTVQSSYLNDSEDHATDETFDTVQFLATDSGAWRIKTYAADQDVHVWSIDVTPEDIVELARKNTEKHYGDVLSEGYIIESSDGIEGLRRELRERGLSEHLEISRSGFVFWAPAGTDYRSKSTPRQ
jgi:hypothetical protein